MTGRDADDTLTLMPLRTRLAVKIGSVSWMPRLLPQIVKYDNAVQRLTGQRYGLLDIAALPNITLQVPGRKSGIVRTTRLLTVPDGDDWLIAGSFFGGDTTPQWVGNIRALDGRSFGVIYRGASRTVTAVELHDDARAAAWQQLRSVWPNFDLYEQRTNRAIPLFRLTEVATER